MIRMGRSSKPEQPQQPETVQFQEQRNNQPYGYPQQPIETASFRPTTDNSSTRAFTESEGLARDIKEGRLSGYVGSGTALTGETNFKAMLRVDGHLTGRIMSEAGTLVIGSTGQVDANISVAAAVINGQVNGDIAATERIELGRSAKIVGNIQTPSLMMEQGAILEGNCSMIKQRAELENNHQQRLQDEYARSESETDAQFDNAGRESAEDDNSGSQAAVA